MLQETLKQIGMEEKEAKIYLAGLELGETGIKDLASKSNIKRTTVYEIIDSMVAAGYLKITSRGKRKRYVAIDPQELKMIMRKKEALLAQVMPQLLAMSNVSDVKPKVWFYQGKDGVMQAYEDALNYPGIEVIGWASGEVTSLFSDAEIEKYIRSRIRKKILETMIMPNDEVTARFTAQDSRHLRRTKAVDAKLYPFKIEINIYANRVGIYSARDKMAVIMESEQVASTMRMIFQMCWNGIR
jgi:sugar-specific transcriptional regulator TrmB